MARTFSSAQSREGEKTSPPILFSSLELSPGLPSKIPTPEPPHNYKLLSTFSCNRFPVTRHAFGHKAHEPKIKKNLLPAASFQRQHKNRTEKTKRTLKPPRFPLSLSLSLSPSFSLYLSSKKRTASPERSAASLTPCQTPAPLHTK